MKKPKSVIRGYRRGEMTHDKDCHAGLIPPGECSCGASFIPPDYGAEPEDGELKTDRNTGMPE
jgi:hypothetical protein